MSPVTPIPTLDERLSEMDGLLINIDRGIECLSELSEKEDFRAMAYIADNMDRAMVELRDRFDAIRAEIGGEADQ